ncbi:hypothetical protein F5878DRAFT_21636 [Lentinula raphanica]|uniref:Pre-rRNA-processing protein n=1 Tax=Lentinula raphanica TaxID=153919 RepID=A0AA38PL05_9AGAR|nr:hypothetical protein F5878DRAFT_21636 [Lentinula raphanica]
MPKSAKRRKEKAADFTKAKLKLGKGKQAPSNAIDTSFKARSIALPSQSIVVEKDDSAPTTRRKLSLDDLLVHMKHHNPSTRKDTIFGFRELFDAHWELVGSSLPVLLNATARVIGDEDASVRKALLSFYSWLIPRIPKEDLVPHAPLILLFTASAQTHIFPKIRIDAVRFLNIFLEHFPEVIVSGWDTANNSLGSRVLEGYLGVLSAGTITGDAEGPPVATSTASVMLTSTSKLVVLQSLSCFLEAATASQSTSPTTEDTWFLSSSFTTREAHEAFDRQLSPSSSKKTIYHTVWAPEMDPEDDVSPVSSSLAIHASNLSCSLEGLSHEIASSRTFCEVGASTNNSNPFLVRLAKTLHPTLVSIFLDCAPVVFSPSTSPPEIEMGLVSAVVSITRTLYGLIIQDNSPVLSAIEELQTILGYMAPFFPFSPSGQRDVKIEQAFQDLNLIYCDLTSRLALASRIPEPTSRQNQTTSRGKRGRQLGQDSSEADRVREYVVRTLRGQVSSAQLVRQLTPAAYNSLLPTVWSLLNYSGRDEEFLERSEEVLEAILEHAIKTGSKSVLKRSTFNFVARLILLETDMHYQGAFQFRKHEKGTILAEEWLVQLPQVLWELGPSNSSATECIVLFLLRLLQCRSKFIHENTLTSLQTRFAPYFHITHPTRGAILGPFAKLSKGDFIVPSGLQRRVLDVVILLCTHGSLKPGTILRDAVDSALVKTEEYGYWTHLKRYYHLNP